MTAKERLSRYYKAKKDIEYIQRQLNRLRESASDIQATNYDRIQVDGSRDADTIGNIVARIEEKADALEKAKVKARQIMLDIEDTLDTIRKPEIREVLCLRYIELKKWEEIADTMSYSTTHVKRLHSKGLKILEVKE